MFRIFKTFASTRNGRSKPPHMNRPWRRLALEPLEDRCTPSVTVMGVNLTGTEGMATSPPLILATFTDSDPTRMATDFSASVNYGDGTALVTTGLSITGPFGGPFTLQDTNPHVFPDEAIPPGGFQVQVTVTDTVDNSMGTGGGTAVVADAALLPGASGPGMPMTFSGVGGDNTSGAALDALNAFEMAVGGVHNTAPAPQTSGFRVITWDGVRLDGTDFNGNTTVIDLNQTVGIPLNRFQAQGSFFEQVYAVSGDGFQSVNPNVAAASPQLFPAFSPNNTFAMFNDNTIDFSFVLASAATTPPVDAASRGFGCIFRNVELANTTSIEYFAGSQSLGKFFAPVGMQGEAEFLGVLFANPVVTKITITLGTDVLFRFNGQSFSSNSMDDPANGHNLAVTDDFVYAEPMTVTLMQPSVAATVGTLFNGNVGSFSDLNPLAPATDFTAIINWGDGQSSAGSISASSGSFLVAGMHTYTSSGTFTLSVAVQDFGGGSITLSNTAQLSGDVVVTGTSGDDTLNLSRTTGGMLGSVSYVLNGGAAVALTGVTSFTFQGGDGNDTMTVTVPSGEALVSGNVSFDGGNETDTLVVDGQNQAVQLSPGRVLIASQPILYTNVETTNLNNTTAVNALPGPNTANRGALTGLTANERYVQVLFLDNLGRLATSDELNTWVNVLTNGPNGRQNTVVGIQALFEARDHLVQSWYLAYLGRPAVGGEENAWVEEMPALGQDFVLAGILSSPEFFARAQTLIATGTPDERYAQALYQVLMGRTASATEVTQWVTFIAARPDVGLFATALDFVNSSEFRANSIEGYYVALLHRPSDPVGFSGWFNSPLRLPDIVIIFQESDEFFTMG
jgi:hypothetical protein